MFHSNCDSVFFREVENCILNKYTHNFTEQGQRRILVKHKLNIKHIETAYITNHLNKVFQLLLYVNRCIYDNYVNIYDEDFCQKS